MYLRDSYEQWHGIMTYGGKCPHFFQDGVQDFLKINEKIIWGVGSSKSLEKWKCGQTIFIYAATFVT